jgi:aarF domain-containing kinase
LRWRLRLSDIPNISCRHFRTIRHRLNPIEGPPKSKSWVLYPASVLVFGGASWYAYENVQPFRHSVLAAVRCSRVAGESQKWKAVNLCDQRVLSVLGAAILGGIDYKRTFARHYESEDARLDAYSQCHTRSAQRVLKALLANGGEHPLGIYIRRVAFILTSLGVFIKMGQHMASLVMLPVEWTSTMRPLQDQCEPTPYQDVEALFLKDMGVPISELFDEFDPTPIGVASLAQVHIGHHRKSGTRVAVKVWRIFTISSLD